MKATIKDVAEAASVSTATVSRVLSRKSPVSNELREHVLATIERLEYQPNGIARSLREQSTLTLGLLISNISNPFFTAVARAVEDSASEHAYSVILCNSDENRQKEDKYLDVLLQKRVDGLIVSPARADSRRLTQVARDGLPLVFVDRSIVGIEVPVVRIDGRQAVTDLVDYLAHLGHERIAVISGPTEVVSGRERLDAFKDAARQLDINLPEHYIKIGDFRREAGAKQMRELLRLNSPPTAVFVANNLMSLGAMQTIRELNLRIPQDVSLASFDDVSWFTLTEPPVTAIAQPTRELGMAAAETLFNLIKGDKSPMQRTMDAQLVIRGSCAVPNQQP